MSTPWDLSTRRAAPQESWRGGALAAALLLSGCAARAPVSAVVAEERAPLGVQVRQLDEGLLVEGVHAGSGADRAGVQPGDLIVSVDGITVRSAPIAAMHALRGQAGSQSELVLRAPLTGEYRELRAERGEDFPRQRAQILPPVVQDLRRALEQRGPGAVRRATRRAIEADFGGLTASAALGRSLRVAESRRPAVLRASVELLSVLPATDDELAYHLGGAWFALGEWARARDALQVSEAGRPPDLWDPTGTFVGDAGGNPRGRQLLARTHLALGERDAATAVARQLLASWWMPELAGSLGMAPRPTELWHAALPPLEDLEVQTLDGRPWRLSEHRGQVVVLSFFATWCGPCRDELPALSALAGELSGDDLAVLAVSVDDVRDRGELPAFLNRLGVALPAAWAPELGGRFEVRGIPALRVIGPDGSLVHAVNGYSPDALAWLEQELRALAASPSAGAPLGPAWTSGSAALEGFLGLEGIRGLVLSDQDLALSRAGAPPAVLRGQDQATASSVEGPAGGELVAWLGGPVVADPGERWVRATSGSGRPRWLFTTAAPVRALVDSGDLVWIATDARVVAVDGLGRLVHERPGGALDLAAHPDGGVWAVDGSVRLHIDAGARVLSQDPAPGAAHVDQTGRVASQVFAELQTARFGPGGALRSIVVRYDGTIVGLDAVGQPAFTWRLDQPARLEAGDIDGDGQDELLVAVPDRGLATLSLSLP